MSNRLFGLIPVPGDPRNIETNPPTTPVPALGVVENMVAGYVSFIGDSLKLAVALVILLGVLMVRPTGLLGTRRVERV